MSFLKKYRIWMFSLCVIVHAIEETDHAVLNNYKRKEYYLSLDTVNFFEAFVNCKQGGMELASVENEDESAALDTFLDPYKRSGAGEVGIWLSGTNLLNTAINQYYWFSTGARAIFTNWYPGQPDNAGDHEHCLQWIYINATGKTTGWNDWICNSTSRYVCEYLSN